VLQGNWLPLSHGGPERRHEPCFPRECRNTNPLEATMRWTKPEAEIVAVTMEVTAYVATL
jgi:coenzyme PQQ precursor peptide PqqA